MWNLEIRSGSSGFQCGTEFEQTTQIYIQLLTLKYLNNLQKVTGNGMMRDSRKKSAKEKKTVALQKKENTGAAAHTIILSL